MATVSEMNAALENLYAASWPSVEAATAGIAGVSCPFLINVPDGYVEAPRRLLIVGQESFGWSTDNPGEVRSPRAMMQLYKDFDFGRHMRPSPFWRASRELHRRLNPTGEGAFLWSNLGRVDVNQRPAPQEVNDVLDRLGWLAEEIRVTRPDVVVFFTGPHYDGRIRSRFPGVQFDDLGDGLAKLRHDGLGACAFRTYHPRYLSMSRRWGHLKRIVEAVDLQSAGEEAC